MNRPCSPEKIEFKTCEKCGSTCFSAFDHCCFCVQSEINILREQVRRRDEALSKAEALIQSVCELRSNEGELMFNTVDYMGMTDTLAAIREAREGSDGV